MAKDLTNSRLDRQNILNNEIAIDEIQHKVGIDGVVFEDKFYFTKQMVADYFGVEERTLERYLASNLQEFKENGYEVLKGARLKDFFERYNEKFASDINVARKIRALSVFDFRAFLDMAMLLAESDKARVLRQMILDIVIDLINRKTGGGTKYINQRDADFIGSSLQEENYRRKFTDALKLYVVDDRFKYGRFTDMIYVSIFKENAKEYRKILDLKAKDKVRDTFYSEILDIVAAYENGLADEIRRESELRKRPLSISETMELFQRFETMALWKPLIHRGRVKMASRDMALREAFHYQLSEYIEPLDKNDYQKFLGAAGDELERLMQENQEVLMRLKERE